jgi:hypothetical protein
MADLALTVIALSLLGCLAMLWFINENLARIATELSWFGKRAEKADQGPQGN